MTHPVRGTKMRIATDLSSDNASEKTVEQYLYYGERKNSDNTFQEHRQNKDFSKHKKDERTHHEHTCTTRHVKERPSGRTK